MTLVASKTSAEIPRFQHLNKASIQVDVGHVAEAGQASQLRSQELRDVGRLDWIKLNGLMKFETFFYATFCQKRRI